MKYFYLTVLSLILFSVTTVKAQSVSEAAQLASKGKYDAAIEMYSDVLAAEPNNIPARVGRGYAFSWAHRFEEATADFTAALADNPNNSDAKKGLAYTKLWSEKYDDAIAAFDELIRANPGVKEFYIAKGQAEMGANRLLAARATFAAAKQYAPAGDEEINFLTDAILTKPTVLDLDVLGGFSSVDSKNAAGLRFIRLASQFTKSLQAAVRYDNSLSMDNLNVITADRKIPYYAATLVYKSPFVLSKAEFGYRDFSHQANKNSQIDRELQYSIEEVLFFGSSSVKLGAGLVNRRVENNAMLLLAGYHHNFSKRINAGLDYFYSDMRTFNTKEHRILATAEMLFQKGRSLSAGFFYGHSSSQLGLYRGDLTGGFLKGYFPLNPKIAFQATASAENGLIQKLYSIAAGFRFRLEK